MDDHANGRVQPRRVERVALAGDFEGWWLEVDADVTLGALEALQAGDMARIRAALADMLADWNYVDKRGTPLPPTADGLGGVGMALLKATVEGVGAVLAAPKAG